MNRIKRNGYQKILSLTLSASLLLGLTGCGAQKAEETAAHSFGGRSAADSRR